MITRLSAIGRLQGIGRYVIAGVMLFAVALFLVVSHASPAAALQTVPYKINYQGRLTDAAGNPMADGNYNMTFRLFNVASAGTASWTEVRSVSTQQVVLKNGQFAVQLGDVTALSPSMFTSQPLYLEIELPSVATATCATAGCASYTEGPMTPRQPLASSAYAMNADTLDGYDSSSFAMLSNANTYTGTNLFKATTNSTGAFAVQNSIGDSLLAADTAGMKVAVGNTTNGITLSLNGIQLTGNARSTRTVTLSPEYPGATFRGDGTNNAGSMSSDFCSNTAGLSLDTATCATAGSIYNYYQWTTTQSTAQDYDVYVRYVMPSDYDAASMSNLQFTAQSSASGQPVSLTMYDNTGTACTTIGSFTDTAAPNWAQGSSATPIGTCTAVAANGFITFKIRLTAVSNGTTRAGDITFTYRSKF